MAATRQGAGEAGGRPARSGAARRGTAGARARRRAPPPSKPAWLWVLMIGGPLILLAGLLLFQSTRSPEGGASKGEDPNARIAKLEGEVGGMQRSYRDFVRLTQDESPRAKSVGKDLVATIDRWSTEWDAIFEEHRDEDGRLPDGLQAYQRTRSQVQQIRQDLMRVSGME